MRRLLKHPIVGDVRGKGLFVGIEFVKDQASKQPFSSDKRMADRIGFEALKRGLITYPGTGSVDGVMGDHILLAPPLIIEKQEIDQMVAILDETIGHLETPVL
jgi:adenosylmethionine-8-amino-7-oxononanoate aminotransferase